MRKSGLEFLGDVAPGACLCQFYHQKEDLLEVLVPFLKAGLEEGEYCLWITTGPIDVALALRALDEHIDDFSKYQKRQQIEVLRAEDWYYRNGHMDPAKMADEDKRRIDNFITHHFEGLREAGGVHRMTTPEWKIFLEYESETHIRHPDERVLSLCTHSLLHCPLRNISKVIQRHDRTFLKKGWNWEVVAGKAA